MRNYGNLKLVSTDMNCEFTQSASGYLEIVGTVVFDDFDRGSARRMRTAINGDLNIRANSELKCAPIAMLLKPSPSSPAF